MILCTKLCKYFFDSHGQDQYLYPPIIAKTLAVSGFAASVFLSAAPAHAISFNFQFQDTRTGGTNGLVKGTLSGLVEGNNSGTGITATVISSPGGKGVGSGYNFSSTGNGNAFNVTSGNITFADASFINSADTFLFLGTSGNDSYYNDLTDMSTFSYADYTNTTTQFTAATPVPFESSPIALPASLAVCFGAAKLRRNHLAKKRMVSVEA
ncbi:MAG: hypothetical protein HEQ25_18555 [Dolichospermum sp. DET73]|nr:hypothetical protein [Dolichospermum sp. DET73]